MKSNLENLMAKEMTRKEFLQYVGSGLLVLFGISGLLKSLSGSHNDKQPSGYGYSAYGGKN